MSNTVAINPTTQAGQSAQSGQSDKDKKMKAAAFATTAAAGIGAGAAASSIISGLRNGESDKNTDNPHPQETTTDQQAETQTMEAQPTPAAQATSTQAETLVENVDPAPAESQPITEQTVNGQTGTTQPIQNTTTQPSNPSSSTQQQEYVDPEQVVEEIIAQEEIDPEDIDMEDIIEYVEVGKVYTMEGESLTTASFIDGSGKILEMVDIDGDDVFDLIIDEKGAVVGSVPAPITSSDAELSLHGNSGYLAQNEVEQTENPSDFEGDIIS